MPVKKAAKPLIDPVFKAALLAAGLPLPVPEYRFHPERKWRWDYAWLRATGWRDRETNEMIFNPLLSLEVQGGIWSRGRHATGTGIKGDMEKFSEGAALGWRLLLVEPKDLASPATIDLIRRALDV